MFFSSTPVLVLACSLGAAPLATRAQGEEAPLDDDHWRLMASPLTLHFVASDEHKPVWMIGLERQRSDGWVWGGAYFKNSFGQPSGYVYVGERYLNFTRFDELFAQWSAGLLYGYKKPYEHKVPFNYHGFSPGAALTLGWRFTPEFSVQINQVGTAGIMFQLSVDLR